MEKQRTPPLLIAPLSLALLGPALPWLTACPALAETYKCREPDGHISYQEMPCPADSDGGVVIPNTMPPSGANTPRPSKAFTVEGQLKALESARREARKAREKASDAPRKTQTKTGDYDAARCAKHRAEVARWRRDVRNGYRDKDEREQETQMLRHHEALVARYCEPER
jgi:hypothetical protein